MQPVSLQSGYSEWGKFSKVDHIQKKHGNKMKAAPSDFLFFPLFKYHGHFSDNAPHPLDDPRYSPRIQKKLTKNTKIIKFLFYKCSIFLLVRLLCLFLLLSIFSNHIQCHFFYQIIVLRSLGGNLLIGSRKKND